MSQNGTSNPPQDSGNDPLASLHRMSTTAGVASQDYVAINMAAVTTFVLGVASFAILIDLVLLVIPVITIIFGIVAIRQISHSNGTQTGRLVAVLGMVVALAISAYVVGGKVQARMAVAREEDKIKAVIDDLGKAIMAGDYNKARTYFSQSFLSRKETNPEAFAKAWKTNVTENPYYGKVVSFTSNDIIRVMPPAVDGSREAGTMLLVKFDRTTQDFRREIVFKSENGQWKVEMLNALFPPTMPQGQQAPDPNVPGRPLDM